MGESEKVNIKTVKIVLGGEVIGLEPSRSFSVDPNAEPWPENWEIIYNVYGNELIIHV